MNVLKTEIPGVLLFETDVYRDVRGYFSETWNRSRYADAGLDVNFVQDNVSFSLKGVLRGLHLQEPYPQGKLVHVLQGEIFDVAVDIRVGSPTFRRWVGATLSSENRRQIYVPPGFAHGFAVVSENALVVYKCTDIYRPASEMSLLWNDPELAVEWPVAEPIISAKDLAAPTLAQVPPDRLPKYLG
jgi:dTDP-4-dehydrorhamnose 3,5-epimerase